MLDPHGFVASCNSTNFFFVKRGVVHTSSREYCFNGITRANVIELCGSNGVDVTIGNFALAEVYDADEGFVTAQWAGSHQSRRWTADPWSRRRCPVR